MDMHSLRLVGLYVTDVDVAQACTDKRLTHIELQGCHHVTDLSPLAALPALREVYIGECKSVRYLGLLGQGQTCLQKLVFDDTPITEAQQRDILTCNYVELVIKGNETPYKLDSLPQSLVKASIDLIRGIVSQFKPEEIGVAFNGGKDSVVVMDLIQCALDRETLEKFCIFTINGFNSEEFGEVANLRDAYITKNGLSILNVGSAFSMQDGLAYVKKMRGIRVVFMGSRRSDGEHQKKDVEPTTAGWPEMLRVSPVFYWGYKDIWGYTLAYNLPFCSLYLKGYTSVGAPGETLTNHLLSRGDGTFRPAWELDNVLTERKGRYC